MIALPAGTQALASPALFVIIDEIPDDIDPALAESVLTEFFERGIAFSCVLDSAHLKAKETQAPSPLGQAIGAMPAREAGVMEIILPVDEDADERRYFQMRTAEGLRAAAAAYLSKTAAPLGRIPIISLMDRREEQPLDLSAQRSAGFRVLIRPRVSEAMTVEFAGRGQMQLLGGDTLSITAPLEEIRAQLNDALNRGRDMMLVLSLADMATVGTDRLRGRVAEIAERIEAAIASRRVVAMRPMDHLFLAAPYLAADRALVLTAGGTEDEQARVESFAEELRSADLPFSVTGQSAPEWLTDTDDFCPDWTAAAADPAGELRGADSCLLSPDPAPVPVPDWVPGMVVVPGEGGAWNGVRTDGRMQLVCREWAQVGPADYAPFEDLVVMIRPGDLVTPRRRQALLLELQEAVWAGRIRLHTIAGLGDLILAPEPVLTRLWSTRRRLVTDPSRADALRARERTMLLDDARLAWRFIDRFTDPVTGLCAGTVRDGPGRNVNLGASLWDLASQLQGIIAAGSMSIIAKDEARDRIALMLNNIPSIDLEGLNLPPAMFRTDRPAEVALRGFDFCDTGRFLIALRSAVASGLASEADVIAARSNWDLASMVEEGNTFNISGTRRVDVTDSHCTPYIARAFAELGLPLRSPYSRIGERGDADELIRLLYSAASIGAFGTEPLLLEAIEQGAAPEVEFLSAVLFDAQLSWYETTGELKCVSEAPLNFDPWFIYLGLRVDRLGEEAWTFETPSAASRFQTAEFRERAEILSAKSAYLWAAVHPHPYCDRLVRVMRDKARIDNLGFSVGVFTHSLEAMENYSDLNTNGIILSAIAAMLEPSWPNPR